MLGEGDECLEIFTLAHVCDSIDGVAAGRRDFFCEPGKSLFMSSAKHKLCPQLRSDREP